MFTDSEIDMLIRGLDMYERHEAEGSIMGTMMGAMLCRTEEERNKFSVFEKEESAKRTESSKEKRKAIIMLKAKVVELLSTV